MARLHLLYQLVRCVLLCTDLDARDLFLSEQIMGFSDLHTPDVVFPACELLRGFPTI